MTTTHQKKIVFILGDLSGGGAEKVTLGIVKALRAESKNCRIWTHKLRGEYYRSENNELYFSHPRESLKAKLKGNAYTHRPIKRFITWLSYHLHGLVEIYNKRLWLKRFKHWLNENTPSQYTHRFFSLAFILRLRKMINKEKPDIVITVLPFSGGGSAFLALRRMGMLHYRPQWFSCLHNNISQATQIQYGIHCNDILQLLKEIYQNSDTLISCSKGVQQDTANTLNIPQEKIAVVQNAYYDDSLSKKTTSVPQELSFQKPFIIAAGRLEKQKRFDLLLKAFGEIADSITIDLFILGEGSQRKELQQIIDDLGLKERVLLLGFRKDINTYLERAACYILSSEYEGYPMILLEAMKARCPIVATRCNYGPEEIIKHQKTGLLVPVNDHMAMAKTITLMLTNSTLRENIVENALNWVNSYTLEDMATRYNDCFEQLGSTEERPQSS